MKKLILLFMFMTILRLTAQPDERIVRMDAIEDSSGDVHIIYRMSDKLFPSENIIRTLPVRYLNAQSKQDTLLLDPAATNKHYHTFQFFDNDPWKYITGGAFGDKPDKVFILKFDGSIIEYPGHICKVFVDNISNLTYANIIDTLAQTYKLIHSTDRGITWTDISDAPEFRMLNVCPFKGSIYGVDLYGSLIESDDRGLSYDDHHSFFNHWNTESRLVYDNLNGAMAAVTYHNNICYAYFYAVEVDYFYNLYIDFLGPDPENLVPATGERYGQRAFFADAANIYTNSSGNDSLGIPELILNIDKKITGMYRSPSNDQLYISSSYYIYKKEGDELTKIFEINSDACSELFPLKKGNCWLYNFISISSIGWGGPNTVEYRIKDTILDRDTVINNKTYFIMRSTSQAGIKYYYLREDPLGGKFYMFSDGEEILYYDLKAIEGEVVHSHSGVQIKCIEEKDSLYAGNNRLCRKFEKDDNSYLNDFDFQFLQGIGKIKSHSSGDFSSSYRTLIGAVIDGVVYGDTTLTNIKREETLPSEFYLSEAYPNPFNPSTKLDYSVPEYSLVTSELFDIKGEKIKTLLNEYKTPGRYSVVVEMGDYVSGVYIIKLSAGKQYITRKIILLK